MSKAKTGKQFGKTVELLQVSWSTFGVVRITLTDGSTFIMPPETAEKLAKDILHIVGQPAGLK